MGEIREYRLRHYVRAERVEETGWVNTRNGREFARHGSYKVYGDNGVRLVKGEPFEKEYVPVSEEDRNNAEFQPAGKRVEDVVEFMKLNPEEVPRVKEAEKAGAGRKKILEYRA